MSAIWPSAVATTLQMIQAANNTKVLLDVDAGIGDTSITVDDASPLPTSGYVTFNDNESSPETIQYTGVSGNVLTGVTRAADGTTAGAHTANGTTALEMRNNAAYHNTLATEIIAIEQNLSDRFGTGTNIVVPSSRTFTLAKTSNQLILGTTNTTTISATAPASSAVYTIPDVGTTANFVMSAGTQTIAGAKTLSSALTITPTSNQLVLGGAGSTNTVTISAGTPGTASRTWTIPDITGNGTFAALEGTQTFSGAKTFSATLTMSGATIAMGSNKITGLAAATANGDAVRFEQISGYRVLQIVSASTQTSASSTSSSFADTNLTASITPASSSSKILVMFTQSIGCGQTTIGTVQLVRNASVILGPAEACYGGASSNEIMIGFGGSIIDSPATSSSVTYKTQFARESGANSVYVQDSFSAVHGLSSITLIEIG